MKTILQLVLVVLLFLVASCKQPKAKREERSTSHATVQTSSEESERLERRRKLEEQDRADSIRLDKILQDALEIANANFNKDTFVEKFDIISDSRATSIEINCGYYFTKDIPHLLIRRTEATNFYIDIYCKGNNKFERVLSHQKWELEYINDTIRDINGDGMMDFVVDWYGNNGCCLKAFSDVYILRPDKKTFSNELTFINPTFSPAEKTVRGICYGHPGETKMYKFRWRGEQIDTVEYVSYQKNNTGVKTGKIIISTQRFPVNNVSRYKVLKSVPDEYRNIEGYDWFTGTWGPD